MTMIDSLRNAFEEWLNSPSDVDWFDNKYNDSNPNLIMWRAYKAGAVRRAPQNPLAFLDDASTLEAVAKAIYIERFGIMSGCTIEDCRCDAKAAINAIKQLSLGGV